MQAASSTLTQRLLNKYRHDAQDALQHLALAVLQQEGIRDDSVLRAGRIASLAPPVAGALDLPEVAAKLLQTRDAAVFEAQRPALAAAALLFIERHNTQFP